MKNKFIYSLLLIFGFLFFYITSYFLVNIKPRLEILRQESALFAPNDDDVIALKKIMVVGVENNVYQNYQELTYAIIARRYIAPDKWSNLWNLYGFHWRLWLHGVFNNEELISILLKNVPTEKGYLSIHDFSMLKLSKPLSSLSCEEKTVLITMIFFPQAAQDRLNKVVGSISKPAVCN